MTLLNLFLIAVGLSMDAFAVSVCKGLAMEKAPLKKAAIAGVWFGSFQALMPLLGYLLGNRFEKYITHIDHWITFGLLALIGANMVKEAFSKRRKKPAAPCTLKKCSCWRWPPASTRWQWESLSPSCEWISCQPYA